MECGPIREGLVVQPDGVFFQNERRMKGSSEERQKIGLLHRRWKYNSLTNFAILFHLFHACVVSLSIQGVP